MPSEKVRQTYWVGEIETLPGSSPTDAGTRLRDLPTTTKGFVTSIVMLIVLAVVGAVLAPPMFLFPQGTWDDSLVLVSIVAGTAYLLLLGAAMVGFGLFIVDLFAKKKYALAGATGSVTAGVFLFVGPAKYGSADSLFFGAIWGCYVVSVVYVLGMARNTSRDRHLFRDTAIGSIATVVQRQRHVDTWDTGRTDHMLTVQFVVDVTQMRVEATVDEELYRSNPIGASLAVRYLPSDPKVLLLESECSTPRSPHRK